MGGEKRQLRSSKDDHSSKVPKLNGKTKSEPKNSGKEKSKRLTNKGAKDSLLTTKTGSSDATSSNDSFGDIDYENVVNVFNKLQTGSCKTSTLQQIAEHNVVKNMKFWKIMNNFVNNCSPRITAMQFHPRLSNVLVIGGKHGELILFPKLSDANALHLVEFPPSGPGGTMEAVRFNNNVDEINIYTASVDGTLSSYKFDKRFRTVLVETDDTMSNWFCSVDVNLDGKTVCGGDNKGNVVIHRLDTGNSQRLKLHTNKVKHIEFNTRDPNLMVTSSLDKTVKLWDLRKITDQKSCIENLKHEMGVSSAKFSLLDGCRLLTCDMDHELRVYKAPTWTLEHKIEHPHRSFQHMTNITPSWHPRVDIFTIGCYPDEKLPQLRSKTDRSIDIFSASKGKLMYELMGGNSLITSRTMFSADGYSMASVSGRNLSVWQQRKEKMKLEDLLISTSELFNVLPKTVQNRFARKNPPVFNVNK